MNSVSERVPAPNTIAEATTIKTSIQVEHRLRPAGSLIGRPGRISYSLPNAMVDPQNEIDPTIAPNSSKISERSGKYTGAK